MNENEKPRQETPLQFKPINKGLGFHPFSDGLPYAPISQVPQKQTAAQTGSGAMAAGFQRPVAQPPKVNFAPRLPQSPQPMIPPRVARIETPPRSTFTPPPARVHSPRSAQQEFVAPESTTIIKDRTTYGVVYALKRVTAFLLDSTFNTVLCVGAFSLAAYYIDLKLSLLFSTEFLLLGGSFLLLFNWALMTAQEVAFKTTLGKRSLGLALEGGASAIFLRAFFFAVSTGFFGLGLLWAIFDPKRRCWHDLITDLQPIELARLD